MGNRETEPQPKQKPVINWVAVSFCPALLMAPPPPESTPVFTTVLLENLVTFAKENPAVIVGIIGALAALNCAVWPLYFSARSEKRRLGSAAHEIFSLPTSQTNLSRASCRRTRQGWRIKR